MIKYLYKRDNKSKIRVVSLILTRYNTPDGEFYTITGESGQNGGKQVKRPLIRIEFGRASRTIEQQAVLEYNSINSFSDMVLSANVSFILSISLPDLVPHITKSSKYNCFL